MPDLSPSPLQTLLEERLQSARGLGWDAKARAPDLNTLRSSRAQGGADAQGAPAWFRLAYLALRSLGLARG